MNHGGVLFKCDGEWNTLSLGAFLQSSEATAHCVSVLAIHLSCRRVRV
jgi:hypothetical protein